MANWKGAKKGKGPDGPEEVFPAFFLRNHDGAINQIILQNNHLVTSSSDGKITIWDYAKRQVIHEFRGDSKRLVLRGNLLYCCSFGVFGNQPGIVSVYDIQRKAFIAVYKGHSLFITDMILSDSSLYTASADHTIRVWDPWISESGAVPGDFDAKVSAMEEKKTKKVLYGHSGVVNCLLLNDRGVLFSGSADNTIKVWTSQGGNTMTLTNTMSFAGHTGAVNALEYANSNLYSGGADDSVRVWNPLTGQCVSVIKLKLPVALARHDDSVFVQHATEKDITQINMKTNKITRKFEGHTAKINVMKFSLYHMYTGSDDGTVRRWNLQRGTCSSFFKGHKDKVHSILLDLPMMLSGSTDTITCIWEILRNENETPDEIAEEEADWKKRKENDAREVAVQLAMQSSPAPVTPMPTSTSPSSPSIGRSQTTTVVATPAATATPAPATESGSSGGAGIDWMSALSMTQNEKAPPKKSHHTKRTGGGSSSARDDSSSRSGSASPSTKRGGLLGSLVRSASELRLGDKKDHDRDKVDTMRGSATPPPLATHAASSPAMHLSYRPKPAPMPTPTPTPVVTPATPPASPPPQAAAVHSFAEKSENSISDDGSESSGLRADGFGGSRSKIGATPLGAHKARPPSNTPSPAPVTAHAKRTLPFSSWREYLDMCGLEEYAEQYETLFRSNAIELDQVPDFNNDVLKELKIKMGHIMKMMKVVNSMKEQ